MSFLSVEHVYKDFGATEVLRDVSFSAERGTITAIIGASGAGKTTLLRCLNFLELPDQGTIHLNGKCIWQAGVHYTKAELRELRLNFGLVFQSFNLFPQYTALQNVRMPLQLQWKEKLKAQRLSFGAYQAEKKRRLAESTAAAEAMLRQVGLGEKLHAYPCELSGGQCQRLAIARALILEPSVLCFDEPTSALDPALTGEVLRVIRSLCSEERAMIVVTHDMDFAARVADRVVLMEDGRVKDEGTPELLKTVFQSGGEL
ncbi:MAG: amino acid ABC transporter ATP-binding protein [Eubacteriales bacterium]